MNQTTRFQGIIPPIVTPLNEDGSINFDDLDQLVEHMINAGVGGLFVLGSTGQVAYMRDAERIAVVQSIAKTVAGRVPIIAGAIELTAPRVVDSAQSLISAGADAVVATAPVYAINDALEIADHYRLIKAEIDVPLLAYDVPVRVHKKLPPELLVELGTEGVLSGVKDSSGDDISFRRLIALNKSRNNPLSILTGHEVVVDAMAMMGADGAVPGLANVDTAAYVRLWNAAKAGDASAAAMEQERLIRLFQIVFSAKDRSGDAAGVGAFKVAMQAIGLLKSAKMVEPLMALDDTVKRQIENIVSESGLPYSA